MKFISLFAGIGGFDLGFERAGMECVAQVERDTAATGALAHHWPGVARFDDVCTFGKDSINGPVDLICGGFPCQDLSVAGRRAGLAGERSGLWFEFARIVGEVRPQWVVIENVPGLLSSNGGRDFAVILHGLGQFGYLSAWRILDAQYFGVAQRRRRVFVVASLGDGRAVQILFESDSVRGDSAPRREEGQGIAGTLESRARTGGYDPGAHGAASGHLIANTLLGKSGHRYEPTSETLAAGTLHSGFAHRDASCANNNHVVAFHHRASASQTMNPSEISPSLDKSKEPAAMTAAGVRRLMPVECERLQGFPDDWTRYAIVNGVAKEQSDSARYRQTGNAVAVPVAEWIGHRIMEANER